MDKSRTNICPERSQITGGSVSIRSISIFIVITILVYAGFAVLTDIERLKALVSIIPVILWPELIMLSLLSYILRFTRWNYFMHYQGHKIPIIYNLEIYLAGFALTLTPCKTGEMVRGVYLRPHGVPYSSSVGTFIAERIMDLLAVSFLAVWTMSILPANQEWMIISIACVVVVAIIARSNLLRLVVNRLENGSLKGNILETLEITQLLLSGKRFFIAAPLSIMAWIAQGLSLYLSLRAFNYELDVWNIVAIYCVGIIAGAISFVPGGLGATEASIILLLSYVGVDYSDAILTTLICRGLTLWLAIFIGSLCMTRYSSRFQKNLYKK